MQFPKAVVLALRFIVLALVFVQQPRTPRMKGYQNVSLLLKFRVVKSVSFSGKMHMY